MDENKQSNMSYGGDYRYLPMYSATDGTGVEVRSDVLCHTVQIVNICMVGLPGKGGWVLVDAGMPRSAETIVVAAERRFGPNRPPEAIILTHGHFDHVGAIVDLVRRWDVPVYAHEMELPYLTGKQAYPEPDATVEGGLVAKWSRMFPNEPVNITGAVHKLPDDGAVPGMPEWRWIHTPGHTPGHVSLFREKDRFLIAGDAFVTVRQDALYRVIAQAEEITGPPRYLTPDWPTAWESVRKLQALGPSAAVPGHGRPVTGQILEEGLRKLAERFDRIAIPKYGRYAPH